MALTLVSLVPVSLTDKTPKDPGNTTSPVHRLSWSGLAEKIYGPIFEPVTLLGPTIASDTTLDATGNPYYAASGITVNPGVTLTLLPGTIIKMGNYAALVVDGTLDAQGTTADPIYITDYRDDAHGGDTNANGAADAPATGWWYGLRVQNGGSASLTSTRIYYAGFTWCGGQCASYEGAALAKIGTGSLTVRDTHLWKSFFGLRVTSSSATVDVSGSTMDANASHGAYLSAATGQVSLDASSFTGNAGNGLYSYSSSPDVTASTFSDNSSSGLFIDGSGLPGSVSANTFSGNTLAPVALGPNSAGTVIDADNVFTATAGKPQGIRVETGILTRNATLENDRVYFTAVGDLTVGAGASLTVPAGRVLKICGVCAVVVDGTLDAQGTTADPIYITDYRDDAHGGDTNANGAADAPATGWWYGLRVQNGGSASLTSTRIYYAGFTWCGGQCASWEGAALAKIGSGSLTVRDTHLWKSYYGLRVTSSSATVDVSGSTMDGNTSHGAYLSVATGQVSLDASSFIGNTGSGLHSINSTPDVTGSTFSGNSLNGLVADSGAPDITGSTFTGNGQRGLFLDGTHQPSLIKGNTFENNVFAPVAFGADSVGATIDADNVFTPSAGKPQGIRVETGILTRNATLENDRVYFTAVGDLTVGAGASLTVPAGRVLKICGVCAVVVDGTLDAQGTTADPVYITDYRDDANGGDTNGDGAATAPATGWWNGLRVQTGGSASLTSTRIYYAGYTWCGGQCASWEGAALAKIGSGFLTVRDTHLWKSYYGLRVTSSSATVDVSGSTMDGNTSHGAYLSVATGQVSLDASSFTGNAGNGLYSYSSSPDVTGSIFSGNTISGIAATGASAPRIYRNTISGNARGVQASSSAAPVIGGSLTNGNDIFGNTIYGVENTSGSLTVDATFNWWGHATGPFHATSNPDGSGNAVNDSVDFGNFLGVSAVNPAPSVSVTPAVWDFGNVTEGSTSNVQSFVVENTGTASLSVGPVAITGTDDAWFEIMSDSASSVTIAPGGAETVDVRFAPSSPGGKSARLAVPSDDPDDPTAFADLTGTGIDGSAPTTLLQIDPASPDGEAGWYRTTPTVTFIADEPGTHQYQWNSTSDGGWMTGATADAPTGENALYYRSIDTSGNTEDAKSQVIKVDTAAPTDPVVLSGSHTEGVWSKDNTVQVGWNASNDLLSGVDGVSYSWSPGAIAEPDETKDAEEGPGITTSAALATGIWYFNIRTRDIAGNWSPTVHVGPFKIDTVLPNVYFGAAAKPAFSYIRGTVFFPAAASDAHSGVQKVNLYDWAIHKGSDTTAPYGSYLLTTAMANGAHSIALRAYDKAGNLRQIARTYYIDNYRPRTAAPYSRTVKRYRTTRLYYKATDPYSPSANVRIVIKKPSGAVVKTLNLGWKGTGVLRYQNFYASLPKGTYYFYVYATDKAGNVQYNVARNKLVVF